MDEMLAYAVMTISAIGFAASLVSHVYALFGLPGPLAERTFLLHVGIFVVWLPAILLARRMTKGVPQADAWKVVLRAVPPWMRYASYAVGGYAILNFVLFLFMTDKRAGRGKSGPMSPETVRGFSGHWMIFYGAALMMAYAYTRIGSRPTPRCANGHEVGPLARFCERCGARVEDAPSVDPSGAAPTSPR